MRFAAFDFGSSGRWNWGGFNNGASLEDGLIGNGKGLLAQFASGNFVFDMVLEAAKENGQLQTRRQAPRRTPSPAAVSSLSFGALGLAALYPFMKRHTHLPQVVLGIHYANARAQEIFGQVCAAAPQLWHARQMHAAPA